MLFSFFSKDINSKIDSWEEKGHLGKIIKVAQNNEDEDLRCKAYSAIGRLRAKESVEALFLCLRSEESEKVKLAACDALGHVATKAEFDQIFHMADTEENEKISEALKAAAVAAKERTPRW